MSQLNIMVFGVNATRFSESSSREKKELGFCFTIDLEGCVVSTQGMCGRKPASFPLLPMGQRQSWT